MSVPAYSKPLTALHGGCWVGGTQSAHMNYGFPYIVSYLRNNLSLRLVRRCA